MSRWGRVAALPLILSIALVISGASVPTPPAPVTWVTDNAAFLSPQARNAIETKLADYERHTGHQLLVWIGSSPSGETVEQWAAEVFKSWGVGRRGLDDGVILFVFPGDRAARIEVGYGLEARVPDVVASRIIREIINPRVRAGDHDGAIVAAVDRLTAAISPVANARSHAAPASAADPRLNAGAIVLLVMLAVGLAALFIRSPRLALYLVYVLLSEANGRGSGTWKGLSRGGGRSRGGGATSRW